MQETIILFRKVTQFVKQNAVSILKSISLTFDFTVVKCQVPRFTSSLSTGRNMIVQRMACST